MTSDANLCSVCGKSKVANPASPDAHCKGHAAPADLKSQLDAIKTPGSAAAPAKAVPPPVPAPKPSSSQQNIKAQLDAIPAPGAAKSAPTPAPAPAPAPTLKAEPSLADQLNAIPTPGAGGAKPEASITKSQLDAIPAPGPAPAPAAAAAPSAGLSFADQLNAIPTPGMSRPADASGQHGVTTPIPPEIALAPRPGQPASNAEQPEWMKKFNTYQSGITASSASGYPVQDPNANYTPQTRDTPTNAGSGFTMIAVLVVVIVLAFFGFQMMNKTPPADFNNPTTTSAPSTSSPSTSLPGTPVSQPSTAPVYSPPGSTTSTPPPESEGSVTFR